MGSQRVKHDWVTELNWTEWPRGFPYFLQFKSEFGNKEFMIWAPVSSQSYFCWLYKVSPSSAAKNIINLILVLTTWWCPCVELSLVLLEEEVCYEQQVLLAKLYLLLPCFILYSKAKLACYSSYLLTSYLCIPVTYAMAPHSSTLAWKIPWTEEPGRLQSMGSLRVGHDWETSLSLFTFIHWRRKWQPTPVFWPGESQRRGSLVGCHLWGRTESDTTEAT